MVRALTVLFIFASVTVVSAQIGRVEVTMDTLPVGGEEQRDKMHAMEAHDRLQESLVLLRDSIHLFNVEKSRNKIDSDTLAAVEKRLSQMIVKFGDAEESTELYRAGTALLEHARGEFKSSRKP